jgi:hypothetical protein
MVQPTTNAIDVTLIRTFMNAPPAWPAAHRFRGVMNPYRWPHSTRLPNARPFSESPPQNATQDPGLIVGEEAFRYPITRMPRCCARATIGQAAVPASPAISRRFMGLPLIARELICHKARCLSPPAPAAHQSERFQVTQNDLWEHLQTPQSQKSQSARLRVLASQSEVALDRSETFLRNQDPSRT